MLWYYQRVQDIDFVHHCKGKPEFHGKEDAEKFIRDELSRWCNSEEKLNELCADQIAFTYEGVNKPHFGLWASPNSDANVAEWKSFVEYENLFYGGLEDYDVREEHWHIVPDEDCKILVLDKDFSNLKEYFKPGRFWREGGINCYILDYGKI